MRVAVTGHRPGSLDWGYNLQNSKWAKLQKTLLIAVWNGSQSSGTYNCIRYAEKLIDLGQKPDEFIIRIDPTNI